MKLYWRRASILAVAVLGGCGSSGDVADDASSRSPAGSAAGPTAIALAPPAAFAVCASCHAVRPGLSGVGPNLAGVWGRKAGSLAGYRFSASLKTSDIVWGRATLDTWLEAPMKMVPGTKMVIGLPNPAARTAVIDYLESLP